jgi:hypothetical protein
MHSTGPDDRTEDENPFCLPNAVHVRCAIRKHEATAEQGQEREGEAGNHPTNQAEALAGTARQRKQANGNNRKPKTNEKTFQASRKTAHQSRREPEAEFPIPSSICSSSAPRRRVRTASTRSGPVRTRPPPRTQIRRARPWRRAGECSSRSSSSATAGAAGSLPLPLPLCFPYHSAPIFFCLSVRLLLC